METITQLYSEFERILSGIEARPGDVSDGAMDRPNELAKRIVRLPCATAEEATLKVRVAVWSTASYQGGLKGMGDWSDDQGEEIDALMTMRDQLAATLPAAADSPAEADPDLSRFGKAYLEWVEARAELAKINVRGYVKVGTPDPDGVCDRIMDRVGAAERELAFHSARDYHELIEKFDALLAMISDRERTGYPNDSRHLLMLSSFGADLHRARFQMQGDGS